MSYRRRPEPRGLECATTIMMLGVALCISVTPRTVEAGSFRLILDAGFTAERLQVLFFLGGVARAAALLLNGHWRWGPIPRAIGATIGAMLWAHFAYALWKLTGVTGTLSAGIPIYLTLAGCEFVSAYRVMKHFDLSPARGAADAHRTVT